MINLYKDMLYKYQKDAVEYAADKQKFGLFFEPGLGKTVTSLSIAQEKEYKKILVVCQKSKILDWQQDIENYLGMKTATLSSGKAKNNKILNSFTDGALVVNYESVWRYDIKLDESWIIIIDESQYLKSRTSKIGKWGAKAAKKVGSVLLLSGTPMNKYEDLYNQLVMLGLEMPYKDFEDKFCHTKEIKLPTSRWPFRVITGYKNIDLLMQGLRAVSTTMKTEEAIDLPKQTFTDLHLVNEKQKTYDSVLKYSAYDDLEIPNPGVLFMRLRQLSSGYIEHYTDISKHKKEALRDFFNSNTNNVNIFYNFTQELNDIKEIAKEFDIKVFEFNGQVKNGYEGKDCKDRFIIASQYQSAAEGLNLQFLSNQLYYSPPTSFMKYKQSLARVHRVGQTKPVFYYRFITEKSIEKKMYKNLEKGKDYDEKVFENSLI